MRMFWMGAIQGMLDWWVAVEMMDWMGVVSVEWDVAGLHRLVEGSQVGIMMMSEVIGVRD